MKHTLAKLPNNSSLIFVNQADGLTGRIASILEAAAVSSLTNSRFLFAWPNPEITSNQSQYSFPEELSVLFSGDFLKNCVHSLSDLGKARETCAKAYVYFKYGPPYEIKNNDTATLLTGIWRKMDIFSRDIIELFEKIDSFFESNGQFFSIHLRCGDVFYGDHIDSENFIANRTLDYTQVLSICKTILQHRGKRIFLFGATKSDLDYIKANVELGLDLNDVLPGAYKLAPAIQVVIDAYIASKSLKLFCSHNSHVTRLSKTFNPRLTVERRYITEKTYQLVSTANYDPFHPNRNHNAMVRFRRFMSLVESSMDHPALLSEAYAATALNPRHELSRLFLILLKLRRVRNSPRQILEDPLVQRAIGNLPSDTVDAAVMLQVNSKILNEFSTYHKSVLETIRQMPGVEDRQIYAYLNTCVYRFLIATGPPNQMLGNLLEILIESTSSASTFFDPQIFEKAAISRGKMNDMTISTFGLLLEEFMSSYNFRDITNPIL